MDTFNISQLIDKVSGLDALLLGILILLLVMLVVKRKKLRPLWLDLKTRRRLKRLGHGQLLKLHCPDGLGYHFVIDRLILRHDGITLLRHLKYPGKIFCADDIDDWTQLLGTKSYRFKNPIYELECQVKAVADCVPGVEVDGYLFFDYQASFPRGHPDRVFHLNDIPKILERNKQHKINTVVKSAWDKLKTMPRS